MDIEWIEKQRRDLMRLFKPDRFDVLQNAEAARYKEMCTAPRSATSAMIAIEALPDEQAARIIKLEAENKELKHQLAKQMLTYVKK